MSETKWYGRFTYVQTGKGITLCEKQNGGFILLKTSDDVAQLKLLLSELKYPVTE